MDSISFEKACLKTFSHSYKIELELQVNLFLSKNKGYLLDIAFLNDEDGFHAFLTYMKGDL
jgi:hypothetical protein